MPEQVDIAVEAEIIGVSMYDELDAHLDRLKDARSQAIAQYNNIANNQQFDEELLTALISVGYDIINLDSGISHITTSLNMMEQVSLLLNEVNHIKAIDTTAMISPLLSASNIMSYLCKQYEPLQDDFIQLAKGSRFSLTHKVFVSVADWYEEKFPQICSCFKRSILALSQYPKELERYREVDASLSEADKKLIDPTKQESTISLSKKSEETPEEKTEKKIIGRYNSFITEAGLSPDKITVDQVAQHFADDKEAVIKLKDDIATLMKESALKHSDTFNTVTKILDKIDINSRTFNGKVYKTKEECDLSKKQHAQREAAAVLIFEKYSNFFTEAGYSLDTLTAEQGVQCFTDNEAAAIRLRDEIATIMADSGIDASEILDNLNILLDKIDNDARIYNGRLYDTREDCARAKGQHSELESLCSKLSEADGADKLISFRKTISEKDYFTEITQPYIEKVDGLIMAGLFEELMQLLNSDTSVEQKFNSCMEAKTRIEKTECTNEIKNKYLDKLNAEHNKHERLFIEEKTKGIGFITKEQADALVSDLVKKGIKAENVYAYIQPMIASGKREAIMNVLTKHEHHDKKSWFYAADIPQNRLNGAIQKIAIGADPQNVLLTFDFSITGNGKSGLVFTEDSVYFSRAFQSPLCFKYVDIKSAEERSGSLVITDNANKITDYVIDIMGTEKQEAAKILCDLIPVAKVIDHCAPNNAPVSATNNLEAIQDEITMALPAGATIEYDLKLAPLAAPVSITNEMIASIAQKISTHSSTLPTAAYTMLFSPNIPQDKINKALATYARNANPSAIIALMDTTLFGNGKKGVLFTSEAIHLGRLMEQPLSIRYDSIARMIVSYNNNVFGSRTLTFILHDGISINYTETELDKVVLTKLLGEIRNVFES